LSQFGFLESPENVYKRKENHFVSQEYCKTKQKTCIKKTKNAKQADKKREESRQKNVKKIQTMWQPKLKKRQADRKNA
jgi:hypothetical protein